MTRETLTTGQIATLCDVAPRTVSKWIDSGALKGYRLPGSKDRRVTRADLAEFMKQNGMFVRGNGILIVDNSPILKSMVEPLVQFFCREVTVTDNLYEVGTRIGVIPPRVVVVNLKVFPDAMLKFRELGLRIICITDAPAPEGAFSTIPETYKTQQLVDAILAALVGERK